MSPAAEARSSLLHSYRSETNQPVHALGLYSSGLSPLPVRAANSLDFRIQQQRSHNSLPPAAGSLALSPRQFTNTYTSAPGGENYPFDGSTPFNELRPK
ncbi:hypothetical protein Y1Q_0015463 [Alligator mississippiensis]|uniref:Uncharacterized protein n=1 Tax=Alligator mississippiensis TaxID=8496 RepID=A0A151NCZ1_ALLMI|nr:hypothetical protein Y1Q_0015463 [Alligator mississippiensis]